MGIFANGEDNSRVRPDGYEAPIEAAVQAVFDLTPVGIIRELKLNRPIYSRLACYGHFGRTELELPWEEINRKYELLSAALKQSSRQER